MADAGKTNGSQSLRPWQQPVSAWERFRIRCAGLFDRVRARMVDDNRMTHYLIALQERAQGFEVEVLKWISAEDTRLEAEIAQQSVTAGKQIPEASEAAERPTPSSTKKERAQWASSARDRDRSEGERRGRLQRQAQAELAIESLKRQRHGLAEQRDLHFATCQQWFDERAAVYNRARTGCFGLRRAPEHRIPVFQHIVFSTSRPEDFDDIGDSTEELMA